MDKIQIKAPKGARKNRKIIGRGIGSGYGSTSGKGTKGQKARAGGRVRPGFEGGQMPLYRRIATRGFSNSRFKKVYTIIKLGALEIFEDGSKVTKEELIREKIVRKKAYPVKILSGGTLTKKLIVEIDKVSKSAQETIISLGGEVIVKEKAKVKEKDNEKDKKKTKKRAKADDDEEQEEKTETGKKEKVSVKGKAKDKEKAGEDGE
ncbi:MAG: 50S ribosomal protein L15 [Spirochaetales bacterium]|nr:50S ribosomal protein L15 [Spirochaetales bacterium]